MELHAFQKLAQNAEMQEETLTEPTVQASDCEPAGLQTQPMTVFPDITPPGMAYVPYQLWGDVYDSETGLQQGTMFPVLDLPFRPEGGTCQ